MKHNFNLDIEKDFKAKYTAHIKRFDSVEGKLLLAIITDPIMVLSMMIVSDELKLPAVSIIAGVCHDALKAIGKELDDNTKRFIGALVCSVLEANGYQKKVRDNRYDKRAVSHPAFTIAQVYERITPYTENDLLDKSRIYTAQQLYNSIVNEHKK
jgi:hypothetical protein